MKKAKRFGGVLCSLACIGSLTLGSAFSASAATPPSAVPAKPENAAQILDYSKVTNSNPDNIVSWDGTITFANIPTSRGYAGFNLDGVAAADSYVAQAKVKITDPSNQWSGLRLVFRGDPVNGPFYCFTFNKDVVYAMREYKNGDTWGTADNMGNKPTNYVDGQEHVMTVVVTPTEAGLYIDGQYATGIDMEHESLADKKDAYAAAKPQFAFMEAGAKIVAKDFDGYKVTTGETQPTPTETQPTPTETEAPTTTTEAPKPTAPSDLSKVPAKPDGNANLITADTPFSTNNKEILLRSKNTVKIALSGEKATGYFDVSKTGLKAEDTYVFRSTINITNPNDQWSGVGFHIRGEKDGKVYTVAIQQEAVYILDRDLKTGAFQVVTFDTEHFTNKDEPYTTGKDYTLEIVTSPDKISVFIDGKAVLANVELAEKRTPLLALESGVADVSVKDITLYNVLPDGSGTGKPNPETGAALPVVAVTVAAAAAVGAAVSMRKKRAEA